MNSRQKVINQHPDSGLCSKCQYAKLLLDTTNEHSYICLKYAKVNSKDCTGHFMVKMLECLTDCEICEYKNCE